MSSPHQAFELALQFHKAGKFQHAEQLYRQVLTTDPHNADALHLLGLLFRQAGRNDRAIEYMRQALHHRPDLVEAHNNLGNALKDQGQLDAAIDSYRQALHLKPELAESHNNLGNAYLAQGKLDEALASFRDAVQLMPGFYEAYNNLGMVLQEQGKVEEAIINYQYALRLKPDYAKAHNNLGIALNILGKSEEAIASFRTALRLYPDYAKAYNNLGIALKERGNFEEALTNFQHALQLKPDFVEACNNLGMVQKNQGNLEEAIANFHRALRFKPDFVEAYNNLGIAWQDRGELDEAIDNYRQALRLKPDYAEAYNNLGNSLKDQGKLEEAIANYRRALGVKPDYSVAHDSLLIALHYHPDCDSASLLQEAERWNMQHAEPLAKSHKPHANTTESERRLRIGYVSPDFRNHPVSYSLVPLLANHNRREVEIFCYAEVARPDQITERLRSHADSWRSTVGLSDERVADLVRQDQVDILVDLALHSANNRLLVFARKPAPVQVAWCGYPGTTGLSAIDYRLTDPFLDPPGENDFCYSEQSLRLTDSFWRYDPLTEGPPVSDTPALASGSVTFGCLNNYCKVNGGVLELWAKVLRAVPQSRLLLLAPRRYARDYVLANLKQQGIDQKRVDFTGRQPRQHYLHMHNRIDVCLDTLPYNGHTTSLDAFWMGVPTITLIGKTVVGRAGWSQLCNLGLPELAARTPEEYVSIAGKLAADLPRLQELRAGMRERLRTSAIMDGKRFARSMEQAFRQIWRKWCQER